MSSNPSRSVGIVVGSFHERAALVAFSYFAALALMTAGLVESPASWWFIAGAALAVLSTHYWRFAHRKDPKLTLSWDSVGIRLTDDNERKIAEVNWLDVQTVRFQDSLGYNALPCALDFTGSEGASRFRVPMSGLAREDQKALWAALWTYMDRPATYVRATRAEDRVQRSTHFARIALLCLGAIFGLIVVVGEVRLGVKIVPLRTSVFIVVVTQLQHYLPHATTLSAFLSKPKRESRLDEWRLKLEAASRNGQSVPMYGLPFRLHKAASILAWAKSCRRAAAMYWMLGLTLGIIAVYRCTVLKVETWNWGIYALVGIGLAVWSSYQLLKFQTISFTDETVFRRERDGDYFAFLDEAGKWQKVPSVLWERLIQHPMLRSQIEPMTKVEAGSYQSEAVAETVSESL